MSNPRVEIFQFEKQVLIGVAAYLIASGLNDPNKQTDNNAQITPRIECRYVWNGYGTDKGVHYWLRTAVTEKWPDIGTGTLFLKVVTRRGEPSQDHYGMLGVARSLFLDCTEPSTFLAWHRFEWMLESQSTPTIQEGEYLDVTTLSFNTALKILFETKENLIFLS